MRAVVVREFGGVEQAALGEMPKPEPKAGEVLVQIKATAVNFVDLVMMSGSYQFKPALPFVPGKLPAGVVAAVGAGVTQFKVGDHAIAMAEQGGFAEFVAMPESQCVKLPASLPFEEAAAMALIYDTAYFALRDRARIKPGESVLVLGATGGVGLAAIQIAREIGAEVLATAGSPAKRGHLASLGVRHVMDSRSLAFADEVMARTGGRGVDVVLDSLAGDAIAKSLATLAASSDHVLLIGDTPRSKVDPPVCLSKHLDDVLACATPSSSALAPARTAADARLAGAAGVSFVDPSPWVCPTEPCLVVIGRYLVFRDSHHLTTAFSTALSRRLLDALPPDLPRR